jgi:uncharacterized protein YrrD
MLHRMQKLTGMTIGATDGEIGKIKDVYFDDRHWAVRYLVVDAGSWLENRKVLISPISVLGIDWDGQCVRVRLSREQVKGSPHIDTDKPVSRQHEMDLMRHYGYPEYWGGPLLWGATPYPFFDPAADVPVVAIAAGEAEPPGDPHLQSAAEVKGYGIQATDEAIGHVEDFLMEDESWAIRYLVIDTRKWWPGEHLVIPPQWASRVDWPEHLVRVEVSSAAVKEAPQYDPALTLSRDYEQRLHAHYRRSGYWEERGPPQG